MGGRRTYCISKDYLIHLYINSELFSKAGETEAWARQDIVQDYVIRSLSFGAIDI